MAGAGGHPENVSVTFSRHAGFHKNRLPQPSTPQPPELPSPLPLLSSRLVTVRCIHVRVPMYPQTNFQTNLQLDWAEAMYVMYPRKAWIL